MKQHAAIASADEEGARRTSDGGGPALAGPPPAAGRRRKPRPQWIGKTLKVIRRVHLYLGLVLLPFVLIFGVSGVLFNHAGLGRDRVERQVPAEAIAAAGIAGQDAEALASEIVARLNQQAPGSWSIDADEAGRFYGPSLFLSQQPDGRRVMVSLRLDQGSATVAEMPPAPKAAEPAFAGQAVKLEGRTREALQPKVAALLEELGYEGKVRPHPRPPPELRFRVSDQEGQRWNVAWNTASGQLEARAVAAESGNIASTMMALHKLHHYPTHPSVTWLWILFADLTGIAMVLWSVTGLVMWWQLKPTRVIGVVTTFLALGIGVWIYLATAAEIGFTG